MATLHTPVLLEEVMRELSPQEGDVVLDGTVGGGGHLRALCRAVGGSGIVVGLDLDHDTLTRTRDTLQDVPCQLALEEGSFREAKRKVRALGLPQLDKALLDLGLSTDQLERSGRGFSFKKTEPLMMTFQGEPSGHLTARDIVNEWSEAQIADVLYGYGEERFARAIARAIVSSREYHPIETTTELADIVKRATPVWYHHFRVHPATKTFQALRIAVNDELDALREGLRGIVELLREHGRLAAISFHSIEDRIVKHFFAEQARAGVGAVLTKKPIIPSREEIQRNPRARSAKLRVFEKNKSNSETKSS